MVKDEQENASVLFKKTVENAGLLKVIEQSEAEPCFFEEYGWDA